MLNPKTTGLIIIDVQEKILRAMYQGETLIENMQKLIRGSQILEIPYIITEQNPAGLGPTVFQIASLLPNFKPIPKTSFSCCGSKEFMQSLGQLERSQVILTGIEAHVCVHQTATDLIGLGYEVHIVSDCISSRSPANITVALDRLRSEGARVTSVEMSLFELLGAAEGNKFKEISRIVK